MILVTRRAHGSDVVSHGIAVFGSGLVGGSVIRALNWRGDTANTHFPLDWTDRPSRLVDLAVIDAALDALAPAAVIDIIWAAGRTGFGCSEAEAAVEREAFTDLMEWTHRVSRRFAGRLLAVHVVSSAGGLFEGQRFVTADTEPRPLRPYGALKLEQERIARQVCADIAIHLYRPSSVYGLGGANGRAGLVNTLIMNAKRHATSRIFGGLDTIRDYVLAADIGKFMAAKTGQEQPPINPDQNDRETGAPVPTEPQTHLMASGKPAALREVLSIIHRVVGRPLPVKLDPSPSNASHITFRASALPRNWAPTDIETGIRQVMRQLSKIYETASYH